MRDATRDDLQDLLSISQRMGHKITCLHGGGVTSVKTQFTDIFGDVHEALLIKADNRALSSLSEEGIASCDLNHLKRLSEHSAPHEAKLTQLALTALKTGELEVPAAALQHAANTDKFTVTFTLENSDSLTLAADTLDALTQKFEDTLKQQSSRVKTNHTKESRLALAQKRLDLSQTHGHALFVKMHDESAIYFTGSNLNHLQTTTSPTNNTPSHDKPLQGKVALVTGAAVGIGLACAQVLRSQGAAVVGFDISPSINDVMNQEDFIGVQGDVTKTEDLERAVFTATDNFGGLDIIVANAGIFTAGQNIENLDNKLWNKTLEINLSSTQRLLKITAPFLKLGVDPIAMLIGSRNVKAPGPGASAYSVSKAGLTQLARVASMEWAPYGIRVNVIHPDAMFDTDLWTDEVLQRSAKRYNMTVDEYKRRNLLKTEITSKDVALATAALSGPVFRKTTGAQIPVDGGNNRVI